MTGGAAFFRAIEAQPDDDTPRLVYADWLDEHAGADADRIGAIDVAARAPVLREVRLERNPIRDRGLLALALADWPALEHLDATECFIRSPSAIGLAESPRPAGSCHFNCRATRRSNRPVGCDWPPPFPWLAYLDLSSVTVDAVEPPRAAPRRRDGHRPRRRGDPIVAVSPRAETTAAPGPVLDAALRRQLYAAYGADLNPWP